MSTTGTVKFHRVIKAPAERLYRAFLSADALLKWLPPHGFTAAVEHIEPKVGGTYRMSFTNFATGQKHSFGGEYLQLIENSLIKYNDRFDDTSLAGEMLTTINIREVFCGCELTIEQSGIPAIIPVEACYLGWQESLTLLALLVEANIPEQ